MDTQKAKEALATFKELYEDGLITEAEFTAKKQEILKLLGGAPQSPAPKPTSVVQQPKPAPVVFKPPSPPPIAHPVPKVQVANPAPAKPLQPTSSIDDALDDFISGMLTNKFSVASTPTYFAPKNVATMADHKGYVFGVFVKGSKLYSCSGDKSYKIWNLQTLKVEFTQEMAHDGNVSAIIAHDKYIITGGWDKLIKMWDIGGTHELKHTLSGHSNYITRLAINDGKLYSGSWDCTIQVWDLDSKNVIATMLKENTNGKQTGGHFNTVSAFVFQSDGNLISAGYDGRVKFWSNTFSNKRTIAAHTDWIFAMVIYKEKFLITASRDTTLKVFSIEKGEELYTLKGHTDMVTSLWLEGNILYSGSMDKTIRLWDADNKFNCVATLSGHKNNVYHLYYTNKSLYSASWDKTIKIWQ